MLLFLYPKMSFVLLKNLPYNVTNEEIQNFLGNFKLVNIHIACHSQSEKLMAFVELSNKSDAQTVLKCDRNYLNKSLISVKMSSQKDMKIEMNKLHNIKRLIQMTCEWAGCFQKFNDRSLYLSHINKTHVIMFDFQVKDQNKCQWEGCLEEITFSNIDHFKLHLSFHAYQNQMMAIGQQIINLTIPKPICNITTRYIVSDLSEILICGWKNCGSEFFDAETFFVHVDTHAIEDVEIPMMSKEKLKKIRYAKCEWVNCKETLKTKSHLKSHLSSHTQKKFAACPTCGTFFSTRTGLLNHCYRQETPTSVEKIQQMHSQQLINRNESEFNEECEGVLTIDEDVEHHRSSMFFQVSSDNMLTRSTDNISHLSNQIKIDCSQNLFKSKSQDKTNLNSSLIDIASECSSLSSVLTNQNHLSTFLVNFDPIKQNSDDHQNENQMIFQQQNNLIKHHQTSSSSMIERKHRCSLCSKSFNTGSLLREHEAQHAQKFSCPHCSYQAAFQSRLKEHILFRHSDTHDFKCKFCQQKFKCLRFLQRHIELHNSEKMVSCRMCNLAFTNDYSLNRHLRRVHFNEQIIFACHICPKQYNRGSNLSHHLIMTHGFQLIDGFARFKFDKHHDGIHRVDLLCCTQKNI